MAKSATDLRSADKLIDEAYESFAAVSEIKHELSQEVFDAQDDETKAALTQIAASLLVYSTDTIKLDLGKQGKAEAQVEREHLDWNLQWLAVEIAKDLAVVGIRVANFVLPLDACAICGGDV